MSGVFGGPQPDSGPAQADFEADRYDIAMGGVSVTADRAAAGDFSIPVSHDGKRPIVRCAPMITSGYAQSPHIARAASAKGAGEAASALAGNAPITPIVLKI